MSVPKYDTQTPFVASYIVLRRNNKIAFVLRSNTGWMNGYYGLPSGKVEKGESFSAAAIREGLEEAGITIKPEDLRFMHLMHRYTGEEDSYWVDAFFEPADYQGEAINAEPHIHSELAWLDPQNLPENVVPSVRFALEQIEEGKAYSEYGWAN